MKFAIAARVLPLFLGILLAGSSCKRVTSRHPSAHEAGRLELARQFKNVLKEAGGSGIRIKRSNRLHQASSSAFNLQALATPGAYHPLLAAVRKECEKDRLDLSVSDSTTAGGLHAVVLKVMRRSGEHVIGIHVREVPRLLRAAIVIDDVGNEAEPARTLAAIEYPLTLSVLPYLRYSEVAAQEAHRGGHEVMLHLPMEPEPNSHISPGKGAVLVGMSASEVRATLDNDLGEVPFVAGVNNHMGSRATQSPTLMAEVMQSLAGRRLYFIDSRTTSGSVALDAARREHVPAFYRTVFLDDTETVPYTLGQLHELRQTVEREGVALAIGHPHATTIEALEKFLPEFERADIELVTPSQIVRLPEIAAMHPAASK